EHRAELVQRRREEHLRGGGVGVHLLFERGQHHPEHREEEPDGRDPGHHTPRVEAAPFDLGGLRRLGRDGGGGGDSGRAHQAASSLPVNERKISRNAKVAMMIVKMTTMTPIAAAWPMSKPRN